MTNQAIAEIKDERLTRENFARALKELGPIDSASKAELVVHNILDLQAASILMDAGLYKVVKIIVADNNETLAGYDKKFSATEYFPWRLTVGERSIDFSGSYDWELMRDPHEQPGNNGDMEWTTKVPTKRGWYWVVVKSFSENSPHMAFVDGRSQKIRATNVMLEMEKKDIAHWLGPIPKPKPPPLTGYGKILAK